MFRFILTEKFVVGSIIFLILFCIGAVIWYQYNTETYRKELTESFELQDQTENTTRIQQTNGGYVCRSEYIRLRRICNQQQPMIYLICPTLMKPCRRKMNQMKQLP